MQAARPPGDVPACRLVLQGAADVEGQRGNEPGQHEPEAGQAGVAQPGAALGIGLHNLLGAAVQLSQERVVDDGRAVGGTAREVLLLGAARGGQAGRQVGSSSGIGAATC